LAKKAIAHIEVGDGQDKIYPYHQIHIAQKLFGHHEFEIHVPIQAIEGGGGNVLNQSKDLIGKSIKINIESEQFTGGQSHLFVGIITQLGFARFHGSDSDIILKGKSPTILLDEGLHSRTFTDMSPGDVAGKVLQDYPSNLLTHSESPVHTDAIPYLVQYQETNYHFLARLADRYGEWFFYNGEELIFGKPELGDTIPLQLGRDLFSFDLGMNMVPINHTYHAYQYNNNETLQSPGTDASVSNIDGNYGQHTFQESENLFSPTPLTQALHEFPTKADLDKYMGTRRDQLASEMVRLHGTSENMSIGMGKVIKIAGNRTENQLDGVEEYGEFMITTITHRIQGNGNYQNAFEAIPVEATVPPINPRVRIPLIQPQPAVVTENHDPDGLGRVKVKFYWQNAPETTPWIRALSTAGGASGGFFVIPEIDDEVMIGFEHNHPDKPFVMGSMYHGKAKPGGGWQDQDNNIKAIKTKSGNEIQIIDTPGSEEIKISTGDGKNLLSLTMAGGGTINFNSGTEMSEASTTINISASDTLNIDANDININAGNNLAITVGADTTIDTGSNTTMTSGSNIDASAGSNLSTSSGSNTSMSAGANFAAEGGANLNLKAGANFAAEGGANADVQAGAAASLKGKATTVEGSATAKVSGATTNIEGQAMVEVKAAVVKLN